MPPRRYWSRQANRFGIEVENAEELKGSDLALLPLSREEMQGD